MEDRQKLVKIFEKVQKIPYRVCVFDKDKIDKNLGYGDCRHKSYLLYQLLSKEGFEVKQIKVLFDWRDLPLPKKILNILEKSDKVWPHDSLKVKVADKWIKVDCTWNPELKKVGFPVTEDWDGNSDTRQVTNGKLEFFDKEEFNIKPNIVKEEAYKFADALNEFFTKVTS